jgi:hypothetical protein
MSWLFSGSFWRQTAERMIKTAAQAVLIMTGADGFNVLHAHWDTALGFALGGAILSLATSIVSAGISEKGSPSLVSTKPD